MLQKSEKSASKPHDSISYTGQREGKKLPARGAENMLHTHIHHTYIQVFCALSHTSTHRHVCSSMDVHYLYMRVCTHHSATELNPCCGVLVMLCCQAVISQRTLVGVWNNYLFLKTNADILIILKSFLFGFCGNGFSKSVDVYVFVYCIWRFLHNVYWKHTHAHAQVHTEVALSLETLRLASLSFTLIVQRPFEETHVPALILRVFV